MEKNKSTIFKSVIIIFLFTILYLSLVYKFNGKINVDFFSNKLKEENINQIQTDDIIYNIENYNITNDGYKYVTIEYNNEYTKNIDINNIIFKNSTNDENKLNNIKKNILYVSRHEGTIANFSNAANLLNFNVTVIQPKYGYDKRPNCFENDKCRSFVKMMCNKYDFIVISDIIPDSYIFLINTCKAKIILEITNRFDIYVNNENKKDYLIRFGMSVMNNKNIVVVENNPFETYFACTHSVFIKTYYLIRPMGYAPTCLLKEEYKEIHDEIAFIERSKHDKLITLPNLEKIGIKFTKLPYKYGGPLVLASYKAILMLPYQVSIMKMMENFRNGVAMIIPSEKFFRELIKDQNYSFSQKELKDVENGITNYVEFYNSEFKDLFVYFDSWKSLPDIIKKTDFNLVKEKVKNYMKEYEKKALNLWAQVLDIIPHNDIIIDTKPPCNNNRFYNYLLLKENINH